MPFKSPIDNALAIINDMSVLAISLLQLLFITDIKDKDTINYTGWVMIGALSANILSNFGISFIVNIRHKLKKTKKTAVQNFREDVILQPKIEPEGPLNVTREIDRSTTKFGFTFSNRGLLSPTKKLSSMDKEKKRKVSRIKYAIF